MSIQCKIPIKMLTIKAIFNCLIDSENVYWYFVMIIFSEDSRSKWTVQCIRMLFFPQKSPWKLFIHKRISGFRYTEYRNNKLLHFDTWSVSMCRGLENPFDQYSIFSIVVIVIIVIDLYNQVSPISGTLVLCQKTLTFK